VRKKKKEKRKKERKSVMAHQMVCHQSLLVLAPPHGMKGVVPDVWDLQQHLISKKK